VKETDKIPFLAVAILSMDAPKNFVLTIESIREHKRQEHEAHE
jgi:hypothetical protein